MKWFPGKWLAALFALLVAVPGVFFSGSGQLKTSLNAQQQRMAALRQSYASGEYERVNESELTGFDIASAVNNGVRFNEVSFVGTHNSYQLAASQAYAKVYSCLNTLTFGLVSDEAASFSSQTLTDQFNCGIRSIELDIETQVINGVVGFVCTHEPALNMNSSCADFRLALEEIKLWSDNNPRHLPITVIIEPKKVFAPVENLRFFSLEYARELDKTLLEVFGSGMLTPADVLGSYESFEQLRKADKWPLLEDTLGKVLFLLHDTTVSEEYIALDETIKTQAMFPMLRYADKNESFASFLIVNSPSDALGCSEEIIEQGGFIVRTRADTYGKIKPQNRADALASGAQIVSTDYPYRTDNKDSDKVFAFANGATAFIN